MVNAKEGELGIRSEKLENELMRFSWECSAVFSAESKERKGATGFIFIRIYDPNYL